MARSLMLLAADVPREEPGISGGGGKAVDDDDC